MDVACQACPFQAAGSRVGGKALPQQSSEGTTFVGTNISTCRRPQFRLLRYIRYTLCSKLCIVMLRICSHATHSVCFSMRTSEIGVFVMCSTHRVLNANVCLQGCCSERAGCLQPHGLALGSQGAVNSGLRPPLILDMIRIASDSDFRRGSSYSKMSMDEFPFVNDYP